MDRFFELLDGNCLKFDIKICNFIKDHETFGMTPYDNVRAWQCSVLSSTCAVRCLQTDDITRMDLSPYSLNRPELLDDNYLKFYIKICNFTKVHECFQITRHEKGQAWQCSFLWSICAVKIFANIRYHSNIFPTLLIQPARITRRQCQKFYVKICSFIKFHESLKWINMNKTEHDNACPYEAHVMSKYLPRDDMTPMD